MAAGCQLLYTRACPRPLVAGTLWGLIAVQHRLAEGVGKKEEDLVTSVAETIER
jgi:hypothetical protein